MFGMSAGEMMIVLIVGVVVVGPKRLPEMMRKLGQYVAKLRRLSSDLRNQSGIDRILREEGLEKEIRELRALRESLSKHALFDSLVNAANKPAASPARSVSGGPKREIAAAAAPELGPTPDEAALESTDANGSASVEAPKETAVAQSSDGTATTSTAASLVKPAPNAVPRSSGAVVSSGPVNRTPYRSFREREYPSYGPDCYDAFPDDIDESDLPQEMMQAAEDEGAAKESAL